MKELEKDVKKAGIVFLNELGVDPGIDHMSAMQMIERIRDEGADLLAFESSTGGLVAPGFENNPWQYKFTWNPRNVVLAGSEGARFLHNGKFKYIPYHKVFLRHETIQVPGLGAFEVYGNRDSLTYRETYGLQNLQTMFSGSATIGSLFGYAVVAQTVGQEVGRHPVPGEEESGDPVAALAATGRTQLLGQLVDAVVEQGVDGDEGAAVEIGVEAPVEALEAGDRGQGEALEIPAQGQGRAPLLAFGLGLEVGVAREGVAVRIPVAEGVDAARRVDPALGQRRARTLATTSPDGSLR